MPEPVVVVGEQIVLAEAVRAWAEWMADEPAAAPAGVAAALDSNSRGATPVAAMEAGCRLMNSWRHHPSPPSLP